MKLLYAEDEPAMTEAVTDILNYHNFMVDSVADGTEALEYALAGDRTPVLLLTAKAEVEDRIRGLDMGADDYLPKPFAMGELLARVRAMLRRKEAYTPDVLSFYDLSLDRRSSELISSGGTVTLTRLEYRMMEALLLNRGIYLSTEELLVKTWGYETEAEQGAVWVYLSNLRKRLAAAGSAVRIRARRGVGYRLEAPDA